jgi:hypothetical protein
MSAVSFRISVGTLARIETQVLPLFFKILALIVVVRLEASDNPALSLDNGQPDDDREAAVPLSSGLFQPHSTLRLIVLIPDEQHAGQIGDRMPKVEDRSAGGSGIGLAPRRRNRPRRILRPGPIA